MKWPYDRREKVIYRRRNGNIYLSGQRSTQNHFTNMGPLTPRIVGFMEPHDVLVLIETGLLHWGRPLSVLHALNVAFSGEDPPPMFKGTLR